MPELKKWTIHSVKNQKKKISLISFDDVCYMKSSLLQFIHWNRFELMIFTLNRKLLVFAISQQRQQREMKRKKSEIAQLNGQQSRATQIKRTSVNNFPPNKKILCSIHSIQYETLRHWIDREYSPKQAKQRRKERQKKLQEKWVLNEWTKQDKIGWNFFFHREFLLLVSSSSVTFFILVIYSYLVCPTDAEVTKTHAHCRTAINRSHDERNQNKNVQFFMLWFCRKSDEHENEKEHKKTLRQMRYDKNHSARTRPSANRSSWRLCKEKRIFICVQTKPSPKYRNALDASVARILCRIRWRKETKRNVK